jgi:hypothetical protein
LFRVLVWLGIADRAGHDNSKYIAVLLSLLATMLAFRIWIWRRARRSEA